MTDRIKSLVVTLDEDIRVDDVESIVNAIKQLRHVADVSSVKTNMDDYSNRVRVRAELAGKLFAVLYPTVEGNR